MLFERPKIGAGSPIFSPWFLPQATYRATQQQTKGQARGVRYYRCSAHSSQLPTPISAGYMYVMVEVGSVVGRVEQGSFLRRYPVKSTVRTVRPPALLGSNISSISPLQFLCMWIITIVIRLGSYTVTILSRSSVEERMVQNTLSIGRP